MTTCDPNVSYQVSRVDILGDESPLSDPIHLPDLFQFAWVNQALTDYPIFGNTNKHVVLRWGAVPDCDNSLVGYNVYRIDIDDAAPCEIPPDPDSVAELLQQVSGTGQYYTDVDPPGNNSNVFLYYVRAVGAPGDPAALSEPWGPLCTSPNAVVVEGHPSSAPGEGGWRIASASPSPPRSEWQTAPQRVIGQVGPVKETIFYHHDHLGTPFVVTDAEGMVVSRHRYSPFGEELAPEGSNSHTHRFTGHERDTDTGLDYMMARYYGAGMGRFLSVDPALGSASATHPQTWNRYAYVLNNPLAYKDPDGEETQLAVGGPTAKNAFGHIAWIINGAVYSQGTSYSGGKDWGVSADAYFTTSDPAGQSQDDLRQTTLMTLDVTPGQESGLLDALKSNTPDAAKNIVSATLGSGSCVAVCEAAGQRAGIFSGPEATIDSAGNILQAGVDQSTPSITPQQLGQRARNAGLVQSTTTRGTPPKNPATVSDTILDQVLSDE
jgi:RHS repeat-associated protein